jgi:tol-pal system beta propeller repeat protein TolB
MQASPGSGKKTHLYWIIGILIGLAFESCVLAVLAGFLLSGKGIPLVASIATASQVPMDRSTPALVTPVSVDPTALLVTPEKSFTPTFLLPAPTPTLAALPTWVNPPLGKIVFVCYDGSYDQICLMNADGSHRRQLTDDPSTNFYPSLSPDGKQIVFSSRRTGNFEIFIMDVNGADQKQLTSHIGNLYAPEISLKGNRIVFTVETGGNQSIWVMKADGSNPHSLLEPNQNGVDPTWSPDGNQIAFASNRNGPTQLFVMNSDGTKQHPVFIGQPTVGGRSSWSPDGKWLAFYSGSTSNHNIYMVGIDGKNLQQLTDGGDNLGPSFSPFGQWIAYTSFRDGNNEIYIMLMDGSQPIRVTINPKSDWQPRWGK